ncbi:hypothetical protein WJX74_006137 [Apatococcus lobatus]|uniref:Uncharacterized protein n=1 Tax=Apatococcus lobatus TaxID=904363 RepID=A0AAW1S487_9CHLO
MRPDRQVAAALEHFLNTAGWTVDHLYASFAHRAGLTQPYFRQGWGDLSIIDFAEDAKLLNNWPPQAFDLKLNWKRKRQGQQRGVPFELLEASFRTPCNGRLYDALPEPSRTARIHFLRPVREADWKGCVVHLAGTGDHTFHRRIRLGYPLLPQGIATMALESPFYGKRRPQGQQGAKLGRVSDLLTLGRATIEESLCLLNWAQHHGFPKLGMSGFSMGGVHASMVAGLFPGPVACIPLLAPRSAAVAFCQGALWDATAWQPFASSTDEKQHEILDTLARAVQPNEVTQAAQHALSPLLPAPLSSPRPSAEQSQEWPFSQPPQRPSMTPPVASLFDQIRHAAAEQSAPGAPAADKAALEDNLPEPSSATSSSLLAENGNAAYIGDSTCLSSSSSSNNSSSSSSHDVASQAHDRSRGEERQKRPGQTEPHPSFDVNSSSSSSRTMPLPGDACWQDAVWDRCSTQSAAGSKSMLLSMSDDADHEAERGVRQALASAWQHAKGWRREQACLRLAQVLETYTDITRFPRPRLPEAAILVAATNDAFVASSSVQQLANYWQGCEVRWVSGGHVLAFLSHQEAFRQAISDAMARLPTGDHLSAAPLVQSQ